MTEGVRTVLHPVKPLGFDHRVGQLDGQTSGPSCGQAPCCDTAWSSRKQ